MWVWVAIAAGLVVSLIIFGVAALRAWRQIKSLKASVKGVQTQLEAYNERLQVGRPGEGRG
jgi:uncharacterized membrane-anchored protein YhcB (DUF1043 family)